MDIDDAFLESSVGALDVRLRCGGANVAREAGFLGTLIFL